MVLVDGKKLPFGCDLSIEKVKIYHVTGIRQSSDGNRFKGSSDFAYGFIFNSSAFPIGGILSRG